MTKNNLMRRGHRWLSIVFTLLVIAKFVAMAFGPPPQWITYAPLLPLLFMMISGLVLFAQPYAAKRRANLAR